MKIKEKSLENLNEALDLLKKELNDETNGITKRERKKLDTIISKLIILIETIYYKKNNMPSIHSVAQMQHRKQEKIEIIERKFKEILEKDYENQSAYKNTEARNHELASLMSQIENWFDIPFLLEDAKKRN